MAWYRTGSISLTNGSKIVAGAGTAFIKNAAAGFALLAPDLHLYEIEAVTSDTAVTLKTPYGGATVAGAAYAIFPTQGGLATISQQISELLVTFGIVRDGFTDGVLRPDAGGTGATDAAGARANLGLDNVNNTSDADKPISILQAQALAQKAPLVAPNFTDAIAVNSIQRLLTFSSAVFSDDTQYFITNLANAHGTIRIYEGAECTHIPFFRTGKGYSWTFCTAAGWQVNTAGTFAHAFAGGNTYSLLFEASTGQLFVQRTSGAFPYRVIVLFN